MRDALLSYEDQAQRLRRITGLVPIQVSSPPLRHDEAFSGRRGRWRSHLKEQNDVAEVVPPEGIEYGLVVGVRLFHASREVVVTDVRLNDLPLVRGPFDAAAYALETPMAPLDGRSRSLEPPPSGQEPPACDPTYRGEVLRFVAVDWGVISRACPLCIYAKPWGTPENPPQLWGYVVVEPYEPGRFPLGGSCG